MRERRGEERRCGRKGLGEKDERKVKMERERKNSKRRQEEGRK